MKAVRYDRFCGIDGFTRGRPEPVASPGEVVVRVEAGALQPRALPRCTGSSTRRVAISAGEVVCGRRRRARFTVGDAVLAGCRAGTPRPVRRMPRSPAGEPSLKSSPGRGRARSTNTPDGGPRASGRLNPAGETIVISGASGGVGFTAAQLDSVPERG